jgi:hypothetical protein
MVMTSCSPEAVLSSLVLLPAQLPNSAAVQLNAKIRLSTRFFCMIFSLDPMVPPLSFGMWRSSARQDRVRGEPQV